MHSTLLYRPGVTGWQLTGPLSPHIGGFVARLQCGQYSRVTAEKYVSALLEFGQWMRQHCPQAEQIDGPCITEFLRSSGADRDRHAALGHLLAVLREKGVAVEPPPSGPIPDELRRYDEHLRDVRGVALRTRQSALRIVEQLLRYKFRRGAVVVARLKPDDVRRFIAGELERVSTTSHAVSLAATLRAYFKYLAMCGHDARSLLGVITTPARWSLSSLPRALAREDVDRVLKSFTSDQRSARRDYAIARLAVDLGLRGGEIAQLLLTDIDWQAGSLTIRRSKSRRAYVMPLPAITGRAIADYVQHERPKASHRGVFVRCMAPFNAPMGADGVRRTLQKAFRRIGLDHGRTHALRHAFACRLVEQGGSIKEVADMLRHRSLDTTLIYAKLDHRRLAAVALPWPGSRP